MGMSQYFDNDKSIKSERRLISFNFNDKEFSLYSDNGVFSKDRFNYGTRVLLSSIDINKLRGNVRDQGCGIEVVSIILSTCNRNINIGMVDVNDRAIELAKHTLKLCHIYDNIFIINVYSDVKNKYDYIITNPPIRA